MFSVLRICIAHGSHETNVRTLGSASIAHNTYSGFGAISRSALSPDYRDHIMPSAPLPHSTGASEEPLQPAGFAKLLERLGTTFFRISFVIAIRFAVRLVLGLAFTNKHGHVHRVQARRLEIVKGESVSAAWTLLSRVSATARPSTSGTPETVHLLLLQTRWKNSLYGLPRSLAYRP